MSVTDRNDMKMDKVSKSDFYLGVCVVAFAIFLSGGFYETTGAEKGSYVVNKFTGSVKFCWGTNCQPSKKDK